MMRIYFRDLDDFPDQRKRINERTIDTSYRRVAERIAVGNPLIDAEAAAAVILGSLINFRVNETLVGDDVNGVDRDRFVRTWAAIYRQISGEETGGTTMPKPKDVDVYIAAAPAQARPILEESPDDRPDHDPQRGGEDQWACRSTGITVRSVGSLRTRSM